MSHAARRAAAAAVHSAAAALVLAAAYSVFSAPSAPAPLPVEAADVFSADYLQRARAYQNPRNLLRLVRLLLTVAVPLWWVFSNRGRALTGRIAAWAGVAHPLRAGALIALALTLAVDVLAAPLVWWSTYLHDGAYGFRTQGMAGWWRDWVVLRAPGWAGVLIVVPLALAVMRRLPRLWPPVLALAAAALAAGLTVLGPLLLEPLWLSTTPLPPGEVRAAVEDVLAADGRPADDILVADASRRSTKANAYVSGLGGTRRVVLYDTLLAQADARQVAIVVAHELAHERHHDITRALLMTAGGGVMAAYGLAWALRRTRTDLHDAHVVPRIAALFAVLLVLSLPLQAALSRRSEAAADWTALELTQDPAGFSAMQRTLARSHLADPSPPDWVRLLWYTHPTVVERLGLAARWTQAHAAQD